MATIEPLAVTASTTTIEPSKKYTLKTSDGETISVDEAVAMVSQTMTHLIESGCTGDEIPIPNVTAQVMAKVIEYCERQVATVNTNELAEYRRGNDAPDDEAKTWNAQFTDVDQDMLFDIILRTINIKGLLDLMCQTVADMMKGKSPEEIREEFYIVNDYTEEEEDELRKENAWAFE